MEHKNEKVKDTTAVSTESKGVLGSVWSAAGHIAETVQHAVQGTIDAAYQTADRLQHDAEAVTTVGGYVAGKVVDKATAIYDSTKHTAESVLPAGLIKTEPKATVDPVDSFLTSPTNDFMEATKSEPTIAKAESSSLVSDAAVKTSEVLESVKQAVSDTVSNTLAAAQQSETLANVKQAAVDTTAKAKEFVSGAIQSATETVQPTIDSITESAKPAIDSLKETVKQVQSENFKLELTMDVVAHLQRIADRTGDKILHETARKAHSACAKGLHEAPGVHLVRVTPEQATELVNLAIMTQDHELADFARYCQSVAATTQIGIEPSPGKIQEELAKGRLELVQQGRVHTGPGYGAAFASVSRAAPTNTQQASTSAPTPSVSASTSTSAQTQVVPAQAASAPSTSSSGQLTMDMVAHLQRIADRTGDKVLHDTARKAHSACAKGLSEAPGVHLVSVTPDQASELVNLAIRTQDHELANFARYCQSVAATSQLGIEPTPGKIKEGIEKGRTELQQQGRTHTGPGYGAAFASISRSISAQNLSRSNSAQNFSRSSSTQSLGRNSRSSSPTNVPIAPPTQTEAAPAQPNLQLTMDVVAHLQRIADRTGDALLHETARRAHSACAKNLSEAPGVHLTWVTPEQATELVNLAIRTQDHELADFARYCQSVAATSQIGIEPSPGKIMEEIEKGRQELQTQGRAHTGPGYGAAFASVKQVKSEHGDKSEQGEIKSEPKPQEAKAELKSQIETLDWESPAPKVGLPSQ